MGKIQMSTKGGTHTQNVGCSDSEVLAIKKNEVSTHATIWVNPGNIVLGKGSQSQRTTYGMISFK